MKSLKWTVDHTKGLLLAVITPLLVVPLVLLAIAWMQDFYFDQLWSKFKFNEAYRIKIITISIIANLAWFYLYLNREKYDISRGIIIGSILYAPYVIYIKFF